MMWSRPQSLCGVALRAVLWDIALLVGLDGSPNPSGVFHYQAVIRPRATGTRRTFSRISSALAVQMKGLGTASHASVAAMRSRTEARRRPEMPMKTGVFATKLRRCHGHGYRSCKITCTTTPLARPYRPCTGSGRTRHRPRQALLRDEHHFAEGVPLLDLGVGVDHFLEGCKEPVAADVETPPVSLDAPRYPAHLVVGFQNSKDLAPPRQFVSCRQARRSGADDDDVCSRFRRVVGSAHRFVNTAET